jgi:hypothetical protein
MDCKPEGRSRTGRPKTYNDGYSIGGYKETSNKELVDSCQV